MAASPSRAQLEQVVRRLDPDATLRSSRVIQGGATALVIALEIGRADGSTRHLVLRRYGDVALRQDPEIAEHEFRLLRTARAAGLPVPMSHGFDATGGPLGRAYLVTDLVDGAPEDVPADPDALARRMAEQLAAIHRLDLEGRGLVFLPRIDDLVIDLLLRRPAVPDEALDEDRVRQALGRAWPPARHNPAALLHGDFWPGNLLWRDGRLVAVIDWEDAALGDPLADLANSRLELLWAHGPGVMEHFTACYHELNPIDLTDLPCWELWAALRPAGHLGEYATGDAARERAMVKGHRAFVARALDALGALDGER
ncbi:MAG TPA: phosphotransferase family protein [Thermomicrobiaceae bacterium]|nr:phosphotransferase family protein [Thermomicrobiaceae bacterium]